MKSFYPNCLIEKKDVFVREPVDQEINEILSSKKRKIILAGSHGSGRSVILNEMERRSLGTSEPTIYNRPEAVIQLEKEPSRFSKDLFEKYFELHLAIDIFIFIKENYPLLFQEQFKDDWLSASKISHDFIDDLNNIAYLSKNLEINCDTHKLLIETIEKFIDKKHLKKLNIAFDRFDCINGSSMYAQEIYQRYFDNFDKVIITTDDPTLDESKKKILMSNGYQIKEITYGSNKDILKEIIKHHINHNNDWATKQSDRMDVEFYTQDIIIDYLSRFGNNIALSLEIISRLQEKLEYWDEEHINTDIEGILNIAASRTMKRDSYLLRIEHKLYIPQKNSNV